MKEQFFLYFSPEIIFFLFLGYVLGSIPFGLLIGYFSGKGDIRKIGSGNIGATNILRTGSRLLAALVLFLDSGKGALAVLLGSIYSTEVAISAGCASLIGHIFPIWLINETKKKKIPFNLLILLILTLGSFLYFYSMMVGQILILLISSIFIYTSTNFSWGGKGVATSLGILVAINLTIGILTIFTWILVAFISKRSSVAALISIVIPPILAFIYNDIQLFSLTIFIALILIGRHKENIIRLIQGVEPRIGMS